MLFIAAMLFSGISAVLLERVAYRPLRGNGESVGAIVLAFLTSFVITLVFIEDTKINFIIALVMTAPIAYSYMRIFKRGRQAPRLAFLISAFFFFR